MYTANVGHGGVSTFLSFDKAGQLTIVEMVTNKVMVYTTGSLLGTNRGSRIITLSVDDVNHDGKLDVLIHIAGMSAIEVLFNTGSSFSWSKP